MHYSRESACETLQSLKPLETFISFPVSMCFEAVTEEWLLREVYIVLDSFQLVICFVEVFLNV